MIGRGQALQTRGRHMQAHVWHTQAPQTLCICVPSPSGNPRRAGQTPASVLEARSVSTTPKYYALPNTFASSTAGLRINMDGMPGGVGRSEHELLPLTRRAMNAHWDACTSTQAFCTPRDDAQHHAECSCAGYRAGQSLYVSYNAGGGWNDYPDDKSAGYLNKLLVHRFEGDLVPLYGAETTLLMTIARGDNRVVPMTSINLVFQSSLTASGAATLVVSQPGVKGHQLQQVQQ